MLQMASHLPYREDYRLILPTQNILFTSPSGEIPHRRYITCRLRQISTADRRISRCDRPATAPLREDDILPYRHLNMSASPTQYFQLFTLHSSLFILHFSLFTITYFASLRDGSKEPAGTIAEQKTLQRADRESAPLKTRPTIRIDQNTESVKVVDPPVGEVRCHLRQMALLPPNVRSDENPAVNLRKNNDSCLKNDFPL